MIFNQPSLQSFFILQLSNLVFDWIFALLNFNLSIPLAIVAALSKTHLLPQALSPLK